MADPNFEHNPEHRQSRGSIIVPEVQAPVGIPPAQPYHALEDNKELPNLPIHETTMPSTIWTRFVDRFRFGKPLLVGAGVAAIVAIMLIVLGTLGIFENRRYRSMLGWTSVGQTKYEGDSWGTATAGQFNLSGKGDGTYYDPGVGVLACGTRFTAQDMVVALDHYDYGDDLDNPNDSPVCGACIKITGPLGSTKATIQDKCPACGRGSLDLSPAVFDLVGDMNEGRIPVSWEPC
ncbi:RlpA-like double-psi beta-barrel-protein domain-containing protein-containing protein [Syncephalastrum racemosum]|uniref:RlpA-like double-psi beta-barrel-protein domain-containing protein-containing protein n=1 Tax=Syncephalastrum racemosum TaxID=13706 RepID=A0A1X2HGJ0_SYNRA|nr:RlpA-like double-psi beta-barrel-protein domain-containing protein-containing protein [Syncephalastrum racemosum]